MYFKLYSFRGAGSETFRCYAGKDRYRFIRYIFILYGRLRSFLPFPIGIFLVLQYACFEFSFEMSGNRESICCCFIFVQVRRKRYNYSLYIILKNIIDKIFKIVLTKLNMCVIILSE